MRLGVSIRPSRLASSPTHLRMVRNASSAWASLIAGLPPPEAPSRFSSLSAMAQSSLFALPSAPSPFMRCQRILKGGTLIRHLRRHLLLEGEGSSGAIGPLPPLPQGEGGACCVTKCFKLSILY